MIDDGKIVIENVSKEVKETVKELLTQMSIDTYSFLENEVVGGKTTKSIDYSAHEIPEHESGLKGVYLVVNNGGSEKRNDYYWHTKDVTIDRVVEVVTNMLQYYCNTKGIAIACS